MKRPLLLVSGLVALLALLAVVCAGAATPVAQKGEAEKPVAKEGAKAVPAVATPGPATVPVTRAEPTAKVVLATADWGNELFADHEVTGEGGLYQRLVHDYFIHVEGRNKLAPGIAKSWSFTPDGLTWSFEIRSGVKFHNGAELTIEDVAFSLEEALGERGAEKASSPAIRALARSTKPFQVSGRDRVSVTTIEPLMFLSFNLSELAADPTGTIFSKAYRGRVGRDGYNRDPSPGATGPFELVRHDKGSLMRFQRFNDYWKIQERDHRFQTLELRLIPELSTRVAALRAGEVDLIEANLEVKDQIEAAGGKIIFAPEAVYLRMITEGCFLETSVIPCTKGVRQALDYAIDKDLIARQIYGPGMAETKGWAYVSPSSLGYEPDLDSWPYDPAKARELLAQAGCAGASCFPSPYTLYTWVAAELPFLPEVAQLVCSQWQKTWASGVRSV
jgi:ABC-type transport system substrate-binding protein